MSAIKNLNTLLRDMRPQLSPSVFAFSTVNEAKLKELSCKPLLVFHEAEGVTVVVDVPTAKSNCLDYSGEWSLITLTVHSDLNAVGLLAAVTRALADEGISVNAVSAYYHDHLFVAKENASRAMAVLEQLSQG